jgi:hypothetical protein
MKGCSMFWFRFRVRYLFFFGLKVLAGRDEEELSCWGWFVMEGEV